MCIKYIYIYKKKITIVLGLESRVFTTRSLNQIYKPKQFHAITKHPLPNAIEPSCVS